MTASGVDCRPSPIRGERPGCADSCRSRDDDQAAQVDPLQTLAPDTADDSPCPVADARLEATNVSVSLSFPSLCMKVQVQSGFSAPECQEPMVEPYILFEALGLCHPIRATRWNHDLEPRMTQIELGRTFRTLVDVPLIRPSRSL